MKNLLAFLTLLALSALPSHADPTPPELKGTWISAQASGTTYWNPSGAYVGGGRGSAMLLEFDGQGHFRRHSILEVRNGGIQSKLNNSSQGTVDFHGDSFSLRATSGHYHTEISGRVTDRNMNSEDLGRQSDTFQWRVEQGADGKQHLILPGQNGGIDLKRSN